MSLYKRGDSWQCRIKRKGERYQKAFGAITRREAKEKEAEFKAEIIRGEASPSKMPTLSEFGIKFLNYLPSRVKPGSYRLYTQCWMHLESSPLAGLRLNEITREKVSAFADAKLKDMAVISVNSILRTLRRALFLAHDEFGLLKKEPRSSCNCFRARINVSLCWMPTRKQR
jgi:hypothetical protein